MKLLHVVSPALGLASHESESPRRASGRCGAAFAYRYQPANGRGIANGAFVRLPRAQAACGSGGRTASPREMCVQHGASNTVRRNISQLRMEWNTRLHAAAACASPISHRVVERYRFFF